MKIGHLSVIMALSIGLAVFLVFLALRVEAPPDKKKAFPRGEIVVGVDGSFPPFASDDERALTGLDIELAAAIADQIDLPVRYINIGYYGLYDALISGEVDMLISALLVDPARMDDVRYTRHYFDNGLMLVSQGGEPLRSIESLAGRSIAFEIGSQADSELRKLGSRDDTPVDRLPYELPHYALDAVRLEIADAALVDATTLRLYSREHPNWQYSRFQITHETYAIALRIDRLDAWKLVDLALSALNESGQLATIINGWL